MTNEQIIFKNRISLMESGIIGTTGKSITVVDGIGFTKVINEPEPIHTINEWKRRGFFVKEGQKAIAHFSIWKRGETDLFKKKAYFFSSSQVEPISKKAG